MPARALLSLLVLLLGLAAASCVRADIDQPLTDQQFSACVQQLADQTSSAVRRPLSRDDFLRIASTAHYDDRSRQGLLVQAGEPSYWWDELAATTDADRVRDGQRVIAENADLLKRIEAQFGVPKEIVVAIYGIETNYGPAGGRIPVLDAAMSLACLRPCPPDTGTPGHPASCGSRDRAYAAVRLLRDGKVRPEDFKGSWAGAFGRTQFEPDTLELLGVDFDGDGVVDPVGSLADALASTANHLQTRGGWNAQWPVYIEVSIPPDQQAAFAATGDSIRQRDQAKKIADWTALGWRALDATGHPVPLPQLAGDPDVYPFLPVGLPGPAFLVTQNFNTLMRYNSSERYAMEVALLAHKLAGGADFVTPWPTDDPGLSRAQVRELQAWLVMRGHTLVVPDGVQGKNTRDAIEQERAAKGMPPGRRVGQRTLAQLMAP